MQIVGKRIRILQDTDHRLGTELPGLDKWVTGKEGTVKYYSEERLIDQRHNILVEFDEDMPERWGHNGLAFPEQPHAFHDNRCRWFAKEDVNIETCIINQIIMNYEDRR